MTRAVQTVLPSDTVQRAAAIMRDFDIGVLPVCDGRMLRGMVTDRDLAMRVLVQALPADKTAVSEVMTGLLYWCYEDNDIDGVLQTMGERQIRRMPVVDRDMNLAGIVSLGDVAAA